MLKSLFPSGIPVEAYDRLPEILQHIEEARRLAAGGRGDDTLRQFLRDGTVESDGARTSSRDLYEAYVRWCRQNAPGVLNKTPGWAEVNKALEREGVRLEQTTEGWYVVDRRLV